MNCLFYIVTPNTSKLNLSNSKIYDLKKFLVSNFKFDDTFEYVKNNCKLVISEGTCYQYVAEIEFGNLKEMEDVMPNLINCKNNKLQQENKRKIAYHIRQLKKLGYKYK